MLVQCTTRYLYVPYVALSYKSRLCAVSLKNHERAFGRGFHLLLLFIYYFHHGGVRRRQRQQRKTTPQKNEPLWLINQDQRRTKRKTTPTLSRDKFGVHHWTSPLIIKSMIH